MPEQNDKCASPAALTDAIKAMRKPKAPDGAAYAEYDKGYNKALSHVLERLPASPAALTGIPCKAFEAAFPAAADCRNKDGYHGIMAVRMEGFAAGVEAAASALTDDRISAIYYKTVQAQRKPDAGPFHIAFARALLAASPAPAQGTQEDARDAARYRVFRESPSFALTMGQFSTPGIIDALCDAALSASKEGA